MFPEIRPVELSGLLVFHGKRHGIRSERVVAPCSTYLNGLWRPILDGKPLLDPNGKPLEISSAEQALFVLCAEIGYRLGRAEQAAIDSAPPDATSDEQHIVADFVPPGEPV